MPNNERYQKYDPALGLQGNIEESLWRIDYEGQNRTQADEDNMLELQADFVEAVIDEYNAFVEG